MLLLLLQETQRFHPLGCLQEVGALTQCAC